MQSRQVAPNGSPRVWIAVLDSGEEAKKAILELARAENIRAASFVALGAFSRAVVGYFYWEKKKYQPIPIDGQVEVITLVGDIAENDKGEPDLHAHTVLGLSDGSTRGGHLLEGHVRPTLEITISETPAHLKRRMHPDINVALIDIA